MPKPKAAVDPDMIPGGGEAPVAAVASEEDVQAYIEAHKKEGETVYPEVEVIQNNTQQALVGGYAGERFTLFPGANIIEAIKDKEGKVLHEARAIAEHLHAQFASVAGVFHKTVRRAEKKEPEKKPSE